MKVLYRQAARDDVVRQFRYYLVAAEAAKVAVRFRAAVRRTIESLRKNPLVGSRYPSEDPRFKSLRSWPVAGFEAIRIYYFPGKDALHIVRILHGKRDVPRILERDEQE